MDFQTGVTGVGILAICIVIASLRATVERTVKALVAQLETIAKTNVPQVKEVVVADISNAPVDLIVAAPNGGKLVVRIERADLKHVIMVSSHGQSCETYYIENRGPNRGNLYYHKSGDDTDRPEHSSIEDTLGFVTITVTAGVMTSFNVSRYNRMR